MVNILQLILATVFVIIIEIFCSKVIGNFLSQYYESDLVKTFKEEWVKYKKPFENAIMTDLKENFGTKSMNIYMRHARDTRRITKGFCFSDNVVDVLFSDMVLRDWPNLIMPEVSLSLPGNLLKVEATVGKMFVDTVYRMMRNESAVLYSEAELDQTKHSPFSLQQVEPTGKVTIIAEDCFLSGFSIVTLLGNSATLGHSTYRLVDCKFTVEISSDIGSPPVIAPYFPKGPGKQVESLLSAPIRDELVQNLVGAMYSYINTSVILGKKLPKYKINQQKLFKQTSNYLTGLCEKLNYLTLQKQKGSIALSDFEDRMETKIGLLKRSTYLSLKDLKLYGLDTAYATRSGGSFEASQLSIADGIRFHSLQIRGKAFYDNGMQSSTHNFAAELTDVTVNIIINVEKEGSKSVHKFDVLFARSFDFSVLPWETGVSERFWYQALVSGYIINEVPARITEHLSSVLTPAANDEEQEQLKLSEENTSREIKKNVKIPDDDHTATDVTNEDSKESVEDPNVQSDDESDDDKQPLDNQAVTIPDTNVSAEKQEKISKTQESDIGPLVTAPDNSAGDEPLRDLGTVEAPNSGFMPSNNDKELLLDSDFFSDGKGKMAFISDFVNEQRNQESLADGKSDAFLDKNFFSDDEGKKPFFSDNGGDKMFISDGDGVKKSVKAEDAVNNNPEMADSKDMKQVIIFASSENDSGKLNPETADTKNDKQVLIFASSENDRDGKNSRRIAHNETVNRKQRAQKVHKRNKKESNKLKLTLRRNPRANITKAQIGKVTTQSVKHAHTSKVYNNTRLLRKAHMTDNEIR